MEDKEMKKILLYTFIIISLTVAVFNSCMSDGHKIDNYEQDTLMGIWGQKFNRAIYNYTGSVDTIIVGIDTLLTWATKVNTFIDSVNLDTITYGVDDFEDYRLKFNNSIDSAYPFAYFAHFNGTNSIGIVPFDTNMQNPTIVSNPEFKTYTGTIDDLIIDNFTGWTRINSSTTESPLAVTGYMDSVSMRIRNNGVYVGGVRQTIAVDPGDYIISFKHKEEAGIGRYSVYDVTNAAYLIEFVELEDTSSVYFNQQSNYFTVPVSCSSIRVDFFAPAVALAATTLSNINIFKAYDLSVAFFLERNIDSFNIDRDYFVSRLYSESPQINERSWSIRSVGDDGIEADRGKLRFSYSKKLNSSAVGVYSNTLVESGEVYHVVCTYKYNGAGTSDAKIYINGVLENESTLSAYIVNPIANLTIGDLEPNPYHPSSCKITDIVIDKREFTSSDVRQLYRHINVDSRLNYSSNGIDTVSNIWTEEKLSVNANLLNVDKTYQRYYE